MDCKLINGFSTVQEVNNPRVVQGSSALSVELGWFKDMKRVEIKAGTVIFKNGSFKGFPGGAVVASWNSLTDRGGDTPREVALGGQMAFLAPVLPAPCSSCHWRTEYVPHS